MVRSTDLYPQEEMNNALYKREYKILREITLQTNSEYKEIHTGVVLNLFLLEKRFIQYEKFMFSFSKEKTSIMIRNPGQKFNVNNNIMFWLNQMSMYYKNSDD